MDTMTTPPQVTPTQATPTDSVSTDSPEAVLRNEAHVQSNTAQANTAVQSALLELLMSKFSPEGVGCLLPGQLGQCLLGTDVHSLLLASTALHTQQR